MKQMLLLVSFAIATLCIPACGGARVDMKVASQPNVNPDNSGRPSPVLVKTYELRNDLAFKQSDFQSLFGNPVQTLGADLIAADELVFIPGEARTVSYKPTPETRFIGLVAGFRQMDRALWRFIKAIDPEDKSLIAVELNDATILVIPEKEAKDWEPEEAVKGYQRLVRPQSAPAQAQSPEQQGVAAPGAEGGPGRSADLSSQGMPPMGQQGQGPQAQPGAELAPPVRTMQPY